MTEIDLLKRVRDDVQDPDPLVLARARQRLLTPPPVRRRVPRRRVLVAGGLALTLAGGFLVADVVSHDSSVLPGTIADASTFLSDAAGLASANPDAPIPPGMFRRLTVRTARLTPLGSHPGLRATQYGSTDTWIPADGKPPFVTVVDRHHHVDFATPEARKIAAKEARYLLSPSKPSVMINSCGMAGRGGNIVGPAKQLCDASWQNPTLEFLAAQPRDPDALYVALRKNTRMGNPDVEAFRRIGDVLSTGIVPADLRAALYQAARKIPGIQLLNDVITVDGRRGRAIGLGDGDYRTDLLISGTNGQYLGTRIVIIKDGPGDINGNPENSLQRGDILFSASATTRITSTRPPTK
jgi:hypothetical protein